MRTVHPSVQSEEKRQASEPAINEGASVSTATVAAAALSTASSSTPPQLPKPTNLYEPVFTKVFDTSKTEHY